MRQGTKGGGGGVWEGQQSHLPAAEGRVKRTRGGEERGGRRRGRADVGYADVGVRAGRRGEEREEKEGKGGGEGGGGEVFQCLGGAPGGRRGGGETRGGGGGGGSGGRGGRGEGGFGGGVGGGGGGGEGRGGGWGGVCLPRRGGGEGEEEGSPGGGSILTRGGGRGDRGRGGGKGGGGGSLYGGVAGRPSIPWGPVLRAAPGLIRGAAQVARTLRASPVTRPLVRAVPTIIQRTAANIAQQVGQGQPVTPSTAVRTLARQTARVLSSPQQCVQAYRRSRVLDRRFHRAAMPGAALSR